MDDSIDFDFSEGDVVIGVDNTSATIPDGWYVCKVVSAKATKKFNEKVGKELISVSLGLSIDEGPFAGAFASGFLPIDDSRQYAAKIRKRFFAALGIDENEFTIRIGRNEDGTGAELKGVIGERVGVKLETNSRDGRDFMQAAMDAYIPAEDVTTDDDQPF